MTSPKSDTPIEDRLIYLAGYGQVKNPDSWHKEAIKEIKALISDIIGADEELRTSMRTLDDFDIKLTDYTGEARNQLRAEQRKRAGL
jgi:hypothetical protein